MEVQNMKNGSTEMLPNTRNASKGDPLCLVCGKPTESMAQACSAEHAEQIRNHLGYYLAVGRWTVHRDDSPFGVPLTNRVAEKISVKVNVAPWVNLFVDEMSPVITKCMENGMPPEVAVNALEAAVGSMIPAATSFKE